VYENVLETLQEYTKEIAQRISSYAFLVMDVAETSEVV
jgi:hypothetical protein